MDIQQRIAVLEQRTVERGCSPAEAKEAAHKVVELKRRHPQLYGDKGLIMINFRDDKPVTGNDALLLEHMIMTGKPFLHHQTLTGRVIRGRIRTERRRTYRFELFGIQLFPIVEEFYTFYRETA